MVTGATGHLGQHVVKQLSKLTSPDNIRVGVHNPAKASQFKDAGYEIAALDYHDVAKMTAAVSGIDVVIYIPSITYLVKDRIDEFENSLTTMFKADVHNLVDVSFIADQYNNPFQMAGYYAYLPARLASSGLKYAVVKNSLYADPLVPYLPELIERHNIIYPVGDQAMSFISRQDSAEAIANVAVKPYLRDKRQNYLLTMSKNYTMPELSYIMTNVTGEKIGYDPVTVKRFAETYAAEGDGNELASMYQGAAMSLMNRVTDDFVYITGHQPTDMKEFLIKNY